LLVKNKYGGRVFRPAVKDTNMKRQILCVVLAGLVGGSWIGVRAQEPETLPPAPAVLLLLDRTAIDYGDEGHLIPAASSNAGIADIGLREVPVFFSSRVGETVAIPGGSDENGGWFTLRTVPLAWQSDASVQDGLENFFAAGPGMGSPDESGERATLLASVPDVAVLGPGDIFALAGRSVCAVLYDGELTASSVDAPTSLAGANLGVAAFQVSSVGIGDDGKAFVNVQVLDSRASCRGSLVTP
jgi:hypothetical protein